VFYINGHLKFLGLSYDTLIAGNQYAPGDQTTTTGGYTTTSATTSAAYPSGGGSQYGSANMEVMNNNDKIEAFNYNQNVDSDGDGIADSQFSGMTCWACDAPNFYDCATMGKPMKCSNTQV